MRHGLTVKQLGLLSNGKQINWSNLKKKISGAQRNKNTNKRNVNECFYLCKLVALSLVQFAPSVGPLRIPICILDLEEVGAESRTGLIRLMLQEVAHHLGNGW